MVERRVCTFCGKEVEPGTGRMYVKKDGVTHQFCTSKCFKNMIELKRVPRRTEWTSWHAREKQVRLKGAEPEPKRASKVRKPSVKAADASEPDSAESKAESSHEPGTKVAEEEGSGEE
ncbi:MAG: hypothetical protein JSU93_00470 [Methanobacteriota archaeon]|nr:MAG: hypothetical protein JSU93_00470 [Euryarchaeota archaeon]